MSFIPKILALGVLLGVPVLGWSLSPIVQAQDFVAGEGEPGFEDGPFHSAQFNGPQGLAFDPGFSVLFVADTGNHRVRAIHLDQKNEVSTLAGTGQPGKQDGPLALATFDGPAGLALLPDGQIAVNDLGNNLLRLIDPKTKRVSTLAGGGVNGPVDGEALKTQLGGLWNLVYSPSDKCLYFSQPEGGLLRKLNLGTGRVETVLKDDPRVPHPAALCLVKGNLYVADSQLGQVYKMQGGKKPVLAPATSQATPSPSEPVSLELVAQAYGVIALAGWGKALYAYQSDPDVPLFRILPDSGPLTLASVWGDLLTDPNYKSPLTQFKGVAPGYRIGFVPDPLSEGRFYVANPTDSLVSSFRDLHMTDALVTRGEDSRNTSGMHELEYPYSKPAKTFRILLIGRSYLYWEVNNHFFGKKEDWNEHANLMTTLAKRMELSLNTLAALEDAPLHYEVLNGGMHVGSNELNVWPYYVVPGLAQKYDVDLVLIMDDGYVGMDSYFSSPLTPEGIPSEDVDPEYALKPNLEKFKSGPLHDFMESCMNKKRVVVHSGNFWGMEMDGIFADPDLKDRAIAVVGKPWKMLREKLGAMKTSAGKVPDLEICVFPITSPPKKASRKVVRELSDYAGIPFMDVCDDFRALGMTYFPYFNGHFTENGMTLFSTILVHELLRNNKIPFNTPVP